MEKKMNTTVGFTFCDGTATTLTLTFYALYQLKAKNRELYTRYNQTMGRMGTKGYEYDELDSLTILYAAYVCAHPGEEAIMDEETFLMKCGSDRMAVANAVRELTNPKN